MARIKKRICCFMLSIFYMVSSVCVALIPAMEVKASMALGAEQTLEMLQILYSVLVNGMIVSGATQGDYTDADTAIELMDSFMESMAVSVGMPSGEVPAWVEESTFTMKDGTVFTVGDVVNQVTALDDSELGTGTWGKVGLTKESLNQKIKNQYRVIYGSGDGSGSGDNNQNEYPEILGIKIAAGFFGKMLEYISDLYDGNNMVIVDPKGYFQDADTYDGSYNAMNPQWYINYFMRVDNTTYWRYYNYTSGTVNGYYMGLVKYLKNETQGTIYSLKKYDYRNNQVLLNGATMNLVISNSEDNNTSNSIEYVTNFSKGDNYSFSTNLPIFESDEAMIEFYHSNIDSGIENKPDLNVHDLINNRAEDLFNTIKDKQLKPGAFVDTYKAIDAAYQNEVLPQLENDPDRNTEIFTDAVSEAVSNVVPQIEIQPNPNPDPGLDPFEDPLTVPGRLPIDIPIPIPADNPITIPESDIDLRQENAPEAEQALDEAMNGARYQYNLNDVFPFCIPFDYIDLLKALSADPKTPSFTFPFVVPALGINNNYEISLSWMNSVMEIVRTCEIVAFIIFLMSVTFKTIKW